ncbi:hypothetical protein N7466_009417 [Penicillium verhagenii]|uniref:uncharacterized protein n=1 Tax=Penicillium verhagenii TaxID=1562060 RepID=UPI0025454264|nr:uncharacterized protein N7466_009417 [Penicillium verhagenii]KAJ5921091.1 hypothetical protein N7466_009417 [Penicillium verhagenii]
MTASSFSNDNDSQFDDLDPADQDWQYAPTPGYFDRTPASGCALSPSPNEYSDDPEELSQNEPTRPGLLQLSE